MPAIVQWLSTVWNTLKTALSWLLDGFLYVLKAAFFFVFDGLLTAVVSIVGALDVGSLITNLAGAWTGLPPALIWVINATGIPTGLSMVFYALVVRMILNLIPAAFTRI
ncbi:DUF2523 family protein [Trichlorobacter ammonificans]|uniref:DUF2523 family protein n=1 Tax=Trichlorobacter ammonificans TaxID=2916410 RepID=UPI0027377E1D|nr:DUF2523 family protein [Trichlorobacter ammonificans]